MSERIMLTCPKCLNVITIVTDFGRTLPECPVCDPDLMMKRPPEPKVPPPGLVMLREGFESKGMRQ